MESSSDDEEPERRFWNQRTPVKIVHHPVTLRREQVLQRRRQSRFLSIQNRRQQFCHQYDLDDAHGSSIIDTPEASDLQHWCTNQSWTYCGRCAQLIPKKLLPSFRKKSSPRLDNQCKCGHGVYSIPNADDVPLILRDLTEEDVRVLRPFDIHLGDYKRMLHGYRQRTGPFRLSWASLLVEDKIATVEDQSRRRMLRDVFTFLMAKNDCSYSKFVQMQRRAVKIPFLYEIFSSPDYGGVECALWPTLYHKTSMCESVLKGQQNRASGKLSYMHKVLSSVADYSLNYEILHYQYDRWLFKTITGAINASKASGCSPNGSLQEKSFSSAYWQWQHMYLIDAVRQFGYPSFFLTISPYEWTFPWPPFMKDLRDAYGLEPTDLPILETLHIGHVLEQLARGYLSGGNCNRWRHHVFGNTENPTDRNVLCYFYRFEFQERGTLHLHMLVWLKDISKIRANLLHASIPWDNDEDAFLVADMQKSDRSSLPVRNHPDCFVQREDGEQHLEFLYTSEDAQRKLRAYVTTLLGSLHCRTDVQLADGKSMLLKYVTSYVTKMHEAATSEGLYCCDVTGFQAAHSFLRTVRPLAPEMIFQLSNIKACWTDKLTKQFRAPYPGQEDNNVVYQLYLRRPPLEDQLSLLEWLRSHTTTRNSSKPLHEDKYLVGIKFVSFFNPVFFFQHLVVHYPHRKADRLRHLEEHSMPETIKFFSQAVLLQPENWTTGPQITSQLQHEGHRDHFISTVVSYVMALHDILYLWRIRVVDSNICLLHAMSIDRLYPLSPYQNAIFNDIVTSLTKRKEFQQHSFHVGDVVDSDWRKYRVLCGKPGTGKSQVIIRAIHQAVQNELNVLLCAPVALLAQGYRAIFGDEITSETVHAAFHIPVGENVSRDINFALNCFDLIVLDEASMVSPETFAVMATTLNRLNVRPVVVIAGDKCQQQPLKTVNGTVKGITSILNDTTFTQENSVKHSLYQQFRILDSDYARFIDLVRYTQPTQRQVDDFQEHITICPSGVLSDDDIWHAFTSRHEASIMTVSRRAAQRINNIVVERLFADKTPLTNVPCTAVSDSKDIFPFAGMRIVITENRDKTTRIVNGQDATILTNRGNTILVEFPDRQKAFVYPITRAGDHGAETRYPFTAAYSRTICKSQGQNLKHLLLWLDSQDVPPGMAYVALSRVRRKCDISILQPMSSCQLLPVSY